MKATINQYQFTHAFDEMDRSENFSYSARKALFEYLEEIEEDTGEEIELDVIVLCCDYSEMTIDDVVEEYGVDISECEDDDEIKDTVLEYLNEQTFVVAYLGDTVLFQVF